MDPRDAMEMWDRIVGFLRAADGNVRVDEQYPASVILTVDDDPELRPREYEVFRGDLAGLRYVAWDGAVSLPAEWDGPIAEPETLRFRTYEDEAEFRAFVCVDTADVEPCGRCDACRDIDQRIREEREDAALDAAAYGAGL